MTAALLDRALSIGADARDSADARFRRRLLVGMTLVILPVAFVVRPDGADLPLAFVRTFDVLNIVVVSVVAMLLLVTFARGRDAAQARIETLPLNVLPADVAERPDCAQSCLPEGSAHDLRLRIGVGPRAAAATS